MFSAVPTIDFFFRLAFYFQEIMDGRSNDNRLSPRQEEIF